MISIFQEIFEILKTEANTANAIAAIASAVAAVLALFVSAVSVFISVRTLKHQQKHNVLSVRPLPEITVADYENSLRIKLRNNGSGPMIVQSLSVNDGNERYDAIIDCMPDLPGRDWNHFSHALRNRTLLPGSEIVLLELTEGSEEIGFNRSRDLARRALAILTISVRYTDVYDSEFSTHSKDLGWFGRHQKTT